MGEQYNPSEIEAASAAVSKRFLAAREEIIARIWAVISEEEDGGADTELSLSPVVRFRRAVKDRKSRETTAPQKTDPAEVPVPRTPGVLYARSLRHRGDLELLVTVVGTLRKTDKQGRHLRAAQIELNALDPEAKGKRGLGMSPGSAAE